MKQIKLSPSKLNEFNACPRCFYDAYTLGIKKPRGIFPGLPGGMDRVLKNHFDLYQGRMLPAIKKHISGVLMPDRELLKKWRFWRTGLTYTDAEEDILLRGALDDCVVDDGAFVPLDYKTKGQKTKDDGTQYYQTQLDCYNLMLASGGYKIQEAGYLVYVYPENVNKISDQVMDVVVVKFGVDVYKVKCSSVRAKEIIRKAAKCLRGIERPEPTLTCEHCQHILQQIKSRIPPMMIVDSKGFVMPLNDKKEEEKKDGQ